MRLDNRWVLPAGLAATVLGGSLLIPGLANADPELPPTTAAELLADLARAESQSFSGMVVQTTDLGLPELPSRGPEASELNSLVSGSTTLRVHYDGPTRSRVAVLGTLAETDVVLDGRDLYLWRSDTNTALHATLPEHPETAGKAPLTSGAPSPQEAAERALAAIDPSTAVSVDGTATVAGRDAYELVLEPRDADTLIGQVRLAVDAVTSLPLRVQVIPRGAAEPAFETGFTEIAFTAPGDEVFEFSPPAGATVREVEPEAIDPAAPDAAARGSAAGAPSVVGDDWTSVLVLRGVDPALAQGADEDDAMARAVLDALRPVSGAYGGGRLFTSPLVSALWLDDGRLLLGAVTPETLEDAALDTAPAP